MNALSLDEADFLSSVQKLLRGKDKRQQTISETLGGMSFVAEIIRRRVIHDV